MSVEPLNVGPLNMAGNHRWIWFKGRMLRLMHYTHHQEANVDDDLDAKMVTDLRKMWY